MNEAPELKELRSFRRGRVDSRQEVRRALRMRSNYERFLYSNVRKLLREHVQEAAMSYQETGRFNPRLFSRALYQDLSPLFVSFLRRMIINTYKYYEEQYEGGRKAQHDEVFVFGKLIDIEKLVNDYFRGRELVLSGIPTTIANRINKLLIDAREENLTYAATAKKIRDTIIPLSTARAAMIARTEVHNAASFASHNYHNTIRNDLGINMFKQWVAVNDARTRSTHSEANGQRVHMDEKFNMGGAEMDYAGDPAGGAKNVINCRCVIIYADEEDDVLP